MKYALIGCGRISPNHIAAAKNSGLEIVGLCDIDNDALVDKVKKFDLQGVLQYSDYHEMIKKEGPELIAIATESGKHAEIALDCINEGCNVIIEKPIALSLKDADEIIKRSKENGININEENIIYVDSYDFEVVSKTISNYLKTHKPPEAIFALSDIFAVATMKALLKHKYAIPEDCAIVGYDDIELARYVSPSLTTIRQNCKEIGTSAAKLLLNQINGQKIEKKIERVPVELIIRGSSKKVGE